MSDVSYRDDDTRPQTAGAVVSSLAPPAEAPAPAPPDSAPKPSIAADVFDDPRYRAAIEGQKAVTEREAKALESFSTVDHRRAEEDRARMIRMMDAEAASLDDLRANRWDPATMAPKPHNLWEDFGSPGFVIAMMASAFSANPMNTALNAGAAAIGAINQGDQRAYENAFDTWKENTNLALKRLDMEHKEFEQIRELSLTDQAQANIDLKLMLDKYNNERARALLDAGFSPQVTEAFVGMATAKKQLGDAAEGIIKQKLVSAIVAQEIAKDPEAQKNPVKYGEILKRAHRQVYDEKPTLVEQQLDDIAAERKIYDANNPQAKPEDRRKAYNEITGRVMSAYRSTTKPITLTQEQAVELQRRKAAFDQSHPHATEDEREAAYDKFTSDIVLSGKPIETRRLDIAEAKAASDASYKERSLAVKEGKLEVDKAVAEENIQHKKNMDASQEEKLRLGIDTQKEVVRHHQAVEDLQRQARTSRVDPVAIVDAIKKGTLPPNLTGLYRDRAAVESEVAKQGVDLSTMQLEWDTAKSQIKALNSQRMVQFQGLAKSVLYTIDEAHRYAEQMKLSGITAWNKFELSGLINTRGNTPEGQLAVKYVTAVTDLQELFAKLAAGGFAPTEDVWKLANRQINENYGVDEMNASLAEVRRLIDYRIQSIPNLAILGPGSPNRYITQQPGSPDAGGWSGKKD